MNLDNLSASELKGILNTVNQLANSLNQLQTHLSTNLVFRDTFKKYIRDEFPMFVPEHILLVLGKFNFRLSTIATELFAEQNRRNREDNDELRR